MHEPSRILWAVLIVATLHLVVAADASEQRAPQIQTLQPGVTLTLVAEHPHLATPTGIDVDEQGRIWVVATHTHFRPDDYVGPEQDQILIFSERPPNEPARPPHVFSSATEATMDLELGPDGWVYLAERDRILRLRDTDGDDVADQTQDLAVLTTEAVYPHNGLEGLAWHPDGDLLFGLGENFAKAWTLRGTDETSLAGTGEGGIFRCSADGTQLRRIARGFWNPFGLCVRADGAMFVADNDPGERPPCRLLHVVPEGDYGYQRKYGSEAHHPFVAWNGELPGTLPMIHPTGEAPCGIVPLGRGLLVPSWSDHRIDFFALSPRGASYGATRLQLIQGGRWFRPGCIAADHRFRDQRRVWYLTDWVDGRYQSHGFGRLWKLTVDLSDAHWSGPMDLPPPNEQAALAARLRAGTSSYDHSQLLSLLTDSDPFVAQAARLALANHATEWQPEVFATWRPQVRRGAARVLAQAGIAPQKWIPVLLADPGPDVRFEAVRWIAEDELHMFRPQLEQRLAQPHADYRLFEALVAAWNAINGRPEAGVRDPQMLLARLQDSNSDPATKAHILRLLPQQARSASADGGLPKQNLPEGLTTELLDGLLERRDDALALEVIRVLSGNPTAAGPRLHQIADDATWPAQLRAEAIGGMAIVTPEDQARLVRLAHNTETVVREEALRALRFRPLQPETAEQLSQIARRYPESSDLVVALLQPDALAAGRPDRSETTAWLKELDAIATPADLDTGRRLFHSTRVGQCANCHRHRGRGNVVGPDLSGQAHRADRISLLQSILEPSRRMAPEYQPRTILLKDGRSLTGIRLRSSTSEVLRDARGQNVSFARDNIESMTEVTTSFMPDGLVDTMTLRELRDLLAFLQRP